MRVILFLLIFVFLYSANLHFNLNKKGDGNNTLLVIGGIHGNEPGGYFASSFLVRFYTIKKGSLWVVPNLNFDSIIKFKRGIYGDMNRKFAFISKNDKDYKIVNDIKKIILHQKVDLVLNLHDGHGFYRKYWQNSIFNPAAWGQAFIIDQENIQVNRFGNLGEIAENIAKKLNKDLKKNYHIFNVKNTKTKFKDEEMRLSLTYFAITHNKPAFAIETSKNIKDLPTKIFYQLKAIEEFMKVVGIEFERDFNLTIKEIKNKLENKGYLVINENTILALNNIKKRINFFPITSKKITFKTDNPLVCVVKEKNYYLVKEAFNTLTILYPQYFKSFCKIDKIKMEIDGKIKEVKVPSIVKVKSYFKVLSKKRVNVIGFSSKTNEANIKITKDKLIKRFSIDKNNNIYRVEIYDKDSFCGMILVDFGGESENNSSKL